MRRRWERFLEDNDYANAFLWTLVWLTCVFGIAVVAVHWIVG